VGGQHHRTRGVSIAGISTQHIRKTAIQYETIVLQILSIYFDAHKFVRNNSFRKYLLVSGIAFLLLFTITIKAILYGINYLEYPVTIELVPILQKFLTLSPADISKGIQATFWLISKAIEANKDAIFSTVFLIIGTPFFSFISSKTEEILSGNTYNFSWTVFLKEIKRGISISVRNSIKQFGLILLITLFALIPLVDIVAPLITFNVQAYYNGILLTDYTLERQGFTVKQSEEFYSAHKPEMFAIGLGFMFLLLIPVIGWFIAPTYGLVASYLQFQKNKIS
jgi:CysZ protein